MPSKEPSRKLSGLAGWLPGSESSEFYLKPIGRLRDQVLGFEFLERLTAIPAPNQCRLPKEGLRIIDDISREEESVSRKLSGQINSHRSFINKLLRKKMDHLSYLANVIEAHQ